MKITKKDLFIKAIALLIFIVGVSFVSFPFVSNLRNTLINANLQKKYINRVQTNHSSQNKKIWNEAKEYNKEHTVNTIVDVFEKENQTADTFNNQYGRVLNIGEKGMMGYIEIPKIDANLSIFHGVSSKNLEEGVGHLEGTSLPVGGKGSHCALAGHRGLPSAKLFTDLDQMKKGDKFYIYILDRTLAYKIDKVTVVTPEKLVDYLKIVEEEDLVTLITCTPYGVNSHHMLIKGHRVSMDSHKVTAPFRKYIKYGIIIVSIVLIWVIFYVKRKNSKKNKYENKGNR